MSLWTAMQRRLKQRQQSPIESIDAESGISRLRNLIVSQFSTNSCQRTNGRVLVFLSPVAADQVSQSLAQQLAESLARLPASQVLVLDATTTSGRKIASLPQLIVPTTKTGVYTVLGGLTIRREFGLTNALITLVDECRRRFDWTLIDGGVTTSSELVELARRADGVYIVLPQCGTSRAAAEQTIRTLRQQGIAATACLWVEPLRQQAA